MNNLLNLFIVLLGVTLLCFIIIYSPRLYAWFAPFKKQKRLKNTKNNKIAVIVPARDESKVITDLIGSLNKQSYPAEFFDVHVIVKDKTDKTVELIKENLCNGYVHVAAAQTCKGDALDFCMKSILKGAEFDYDAYLIIDADCTLSDTYMEEMNNALASGRQIIQAKKVVKNYLINNKKANSWASSCNGIIWTIIDELGNRYKSDRNITGMTIGTGIMLRADVVKQLGGWPYRQTLTEDIELMFDCVLKDFTTFYYSYAVMYLEEATKLSVTNKRRKRWLTGVIDSKRLYYKRVCECADTPQKKRNKYFTCALYPVFWFVGTFAVIGTVSLLVGATLALFNVSLYAKALIIGAAAFGTIYLSFLILTAFCMIIDRKHIKLNLLKKLVLLFTHPIFYMGYIPIIGKALFFKNNRGWEVIERIDYGFEKPKGV